jgi:hypothetical protein
MTRRKSGRTAQTPAHAGMSATQLASGGIPAAIDETAIVAAAAVPVRAADRSVPGAVTTDTSMGPWAKSKKHPKKPCAACRGRHRVHTCRLSFAKAMENAKAALAAQQAAREGAKAHPINQPAGCVVPQPKHPKQPRAVQDAAGAESESQHPELGSLWGPSSCHIEHLPARRRHSAENELWDGFLMLEGGMRIGLKVSLTGDVSWARTLSDRCADVEADRSAHSGEFDAK